jgi:hypothetical protein
MLKLMLKHPVISGALIAAALLKLGLLAWLFTTPEGLCTSFIIGCIFAALKDAK